MSLHILKSAVEEAKPRGKGVKSDYEIMRANSTRPISLPKSW